MKYFGTGVITESDYKEAKFIGKTKAGTPIIITLHNALNTGNIDWTFAEKNDTVPNVVFEACYDNTDSASDSTIEPWEINCDDETETGADEILLGAGTYLLDNVEVGLTRGGGKFTVEREIREINADGDRGAVKGRVVMEGSRAKLEFNALTMLTKLSTIYPAIGTSV